MKITNLSSTKTLQFNDLGSFMKGVSPILRDIKLKPSTSKYLLETGEVLLSAQAGDIHRFMAAGLLSMDDTITVTTVLTHNLGIAPRVMILKQAGITWVPAADADVTLVHNAAFTTLTATVVNAGTYKIRLF